jgi:subtilisin family serine protease
MTRLFFAALIAWSLALLASPAAAATPAGDPQHEILVMVRHPVDHYRPGDAYGGGYDNDMARSERQRLARRIAEAYRLRLVDDWPMPRIGMDCFVMEVADERTTTAAADQVSHDSAVAWAQPVAVYQAQGGAAHNDPLYPAQPAARQWQLASLHRISTGKGIRIAVIDSGIEANHPDLAGQVVMNRNFVAGQSERDDQHGTGVAGVIAAKADNHVGIAGVAPDARLLGLRACWQSSGTATVCDSFSLAKAIYFAAEQKAEVINLSLSGPDDRLLRELLKRAMADGATVVAAYDEKHPDGGFPATLPGVIAVADVALAPSRGPVYIAPGRDVPTTQPGGKWFLVDGSSYAAAHVSGLVALMRQRRHAALPLVAERRGSGVIDACASLLLAAGPCDCSCGGRRVGVPAMAR